MYSVSLWPQNMLKVIPHGMTKMLSRNEKNLKFLGLSRRKVSTRVVSLFVYYVSSIYLELEWSYVIQLNITR